MKLDLRKKKGTQTVLKLEFMKKKIEYTDGPIGDITLVDDFLPPPEKLIFKEDVSDDKADPQSCNSKTK